MARRRRVWGFDDCERDVLAAATVAIPTLRAVIARAERRVDLALVAHPGDASSSYRHDA
jgi:hypothetical protein